MTGASSLILQFFSDYWLVCFHSIQPVDGRLLFLNISPSTAILVSGSDDISITRTLYLWSYIGECLQFESIGWCHWVVIFWLPVIADLHGRCIGIGCYLMMEEALSFNWDLNHVRISTQAICFSAFLVGFITVLCIGNYFRAKRAQERQRQRRLAKLANNGGQAEYATDDLFSAGAYEAPGIIPQGVHA